MGLGWRDWGRGGGGGGGEVERLVGEIGGEIGGGGGVERLEVDGSWMLWDLVEGR